MESVPYRTGWCHPSFAGLCKHETSLPKAAGLILYKTRVDGCRNFRFLAGSLSSLRLVDELLDGAREQTALVDLINLAAYYHFVPFPKAELS